jgi:hypothetical protein
LGFKANYFDVETGEHYWISGPRKALYASNVPTEIDEDAREEYWSVIRKKPNLKDSHGCHFWQFLPGWSRGSTTLILDKEAKHGRSTTTPPEPDQTRKKARPSETAEAGMRQPFLETFDPLPMRRPSGST